MTIEVAIAMFVGGLTGNMISRLIADKIQRWLDARQRREMRRGK